MNFYSRFIAGTERHSLRDNTVSLSECHSVPAIQPL